MLVSALREWDRKLEFLCSKDGGGKGSGRVVLSSVEAVKRCIIKYAADIPRRSRAEGDCVLVDLGTRREPEEYEFKVVAGTGPGGTEGYMVTCTSCGLPAANVSEFIESSADGDKCEYFMSKLVESVLQKEWALKFPPPESWKPKQGAEGQTKPKQGAQAPTKPKPVDAKGKTGEKGKSCVIC
jgi:hypothetical protein